MISKWKDVQIYLKPKYNLVSTFDQEFGIQATVPKYGNLREVFYSAYDPTYPIRLGSKPKFTAGELTSYIFMAIKEQPAVYTKFKNSLLGVWRHETGLTAKPFVSKWLIVSSSIAWQYTLPFKSDAKPQWLALVTFAFPLGR